MKKKWQLFLLVILGAVAIGTISLWVPALLGLADRLEGPPVSTEAVESPLPPAAETDLSRLERGLVSVRYIGSSEGKIKARITRAEGTTYTYDLDCRGGWAVLALTQGDGAYTLTVLEQAEGTYYLPVFTQELELVLADPMAPYLEPNQHVNYTADSRAVVLAGELTAGLETDADKAAALFDYVTDNLTYDEDKAALAGEGEMAGYLPNVDQVLAEGRAICFDYAAVLCAMLRSQGIPCRMELGDVDDGYHAWVRAWCGAAGTIDGIIPVEAGAWTLLDPTFVSSRKQKGEPLTEAGWKSYETKYVY